MFDFPNAPVLNQQVLEPNGAVLRWDGVKWVNAAGQVSSVTPTYNNVGRNLLHNALFNITQRGTGPFTANGAFTADRWQQWFGGGSLSTTINAAPDAFRAQTSDEACTSVLFLTFTGTASAGDLAIVQQNLEGVRRLSGKTVTVSFWAASGTGLKLGVSIDQSFGAGGSPSANVTGTGQSVTLTGSLARYSLTFAIPSTAGKTLGTAADMTQMSFWLSAGSNFAARAGNVGVQSGAVSLWGVQLEIGSVATPLEKPDPQQDLAKCQRFYQIGQIISSTYHVAGASTTLSGILPVSMRATPTMAITNNSNGNISGFTLTGVQPNVGTSATTVMAQGTVVATGGVNHNFTFSASADL